MRFLRCVSQQEPFSTSFHTTLTIIVIIIKEMLHPIKRECEFETLLELILFLEISLDKRKGDLITLSQRDKTINESGFFFLNTIQNCPQRMEI